MKKEEICMNSDFMYGTMRLLLENANDNFRKGAESRQPEIDDLVNSIKKLYNTYSFSSHVRPPQATKIMEDILIKYLPDDDVLKKVLLSKDEE